MRLMPGSGWGASPARTEAKSPKYKALERIGHELRSVYAGVLAEPLPERLTLALLRLDKPDKHPQR